MTSNVASPTASSRTLVPAGAGVRTLAVVVAMPTMQVIVVASSRSSAQGPPELH